MIAPERHDPFAHRPAAQLGRTLWIGLMLAVGLSLGACSEEVAGCFDDTVDLSVCDAANGPFSLTIDNPYFPLAVGDRLVLEGMEGRTLLRVEIDVLDETEDVGGITTRVVTETEYEGGELVEVSRNYFAQAPDGTVCYFGEAVEDYEDGVIVSRSGEWRADEGGAQAGIIMPADPAEGQAYFQEVAPGVAEDMGSITAVGVSVTTPFGTFDDAIESVDCNPLDGGRGRKYYAPGVGIIVDADVRLIERSP